MAPHYYCPRLLCRSTRRLAEEDDSQAATCSQRSCATVRVVSNCGKYDRGLTHFWHHVLHWLDVSDRIRMYKCQHSMTLGYLVDLCRPVSSIDSHKHLRSANRGQLQVSRTRMSTDGSRAFGHAGPSTWNALLSILKCSTHSLPTFRRHLKYFYFSFYRHTERVRRYYS